MLNIINIFNSTYFKILKNCWKAKHNYINHQCQWWKYSNKWKNEFFLTWNEIHTHTPGFTESIYLHTLSFNWSHLTIIMPSISVTGRQVVVDLFSIHLFRYDNIVNIIIYMIWIQLNSWFIQSITFFLINTFKSVKSYEIVIYSIQRENAPILCMQTDRSISEGPFPYLWIYRRPRLLSGLRVLVL